MATVGAGRDAGQNLCGCRDDVVGGLPAGSDLDLLREGLYGCFGGAFARELVVLSPGSIVLAGNHTDHQGGHAVACAVGSYARGIFRANGEGRIRVGGRGLPAIQLDSADLDARDGGLDDLSAMVRCMVALFLQRGLALGDALGFDAYLALDEPVGSGLLGESAFELAFAQGLNNLWAGGTLSGEELALAALRVARERLGGSSAPMWQLPVALGGIQHLSFADSGGAVAERIDFDFAQEGYNVCLVEVGDGRVTEPASCSSILQEMQAVAGALGAERLGDVREVDFMMDLPVIRDQFGDRAALRAIHFWREDRMVEHRVRALKAKDMHAFLELTRASGASTAMYLQGTPRVARSQAIMLGLAVADENLRHEGAACIHGGSPERAILAFVPDSVYELFSQGMNAIYGEGACRAYEVVDEGASAWWL